MFKDILKDYMHALVSQSIVTEHGEFSKEQTGKTSASRCAKLLDKHAGKGGSTSY